MSETAREFIQLNSVSELPTSPDRIILNAGHTTNLRDLGWLPDEYCYDVNTTLAGRIIKATYASVSVDALLSNDDIKQNNEVILSGQTSMDSLEEKMPAQDYLFKIIDEEIDQETPEHALEKVLVEMRQGEIPVIPGKTEKLTNKVDGFVNKVLPRYNSALAIKSLLNQLKGPESEIRTRVNHSVNQVLSQDLNSRSEHARQLANEIGVEINKRI